MPEVLFYQLEGRRLETVLPDLLQRCLGRGWRVVVRIGSEERLEALNDHLWSFDDASFLPHGGPADGHADEQPIWLTVGVDNPNGAAVQFVVDGADTRDFQPFERTVFLFETTPETTATARLAWKAAKEQGCDVTFWREGEGGRWEKQGA